METLDRAEDMFDAGRFEAVLSMLKNLYDQTLPSSDRGRALALEVVCLEMLERPQEAQDVLIDIMKEEGDDHAFVLAAGIEFSDLDAFGYAETFLRNLCELQTESHLPWFNLAVSLGREGRHADSAQAYAECVAREPGFADAYVQQAFCYESLGKTDEAANAYREYLKRVPEDHEAWKSLAVVESDRKNYAAAYEAFQKAAAAPDDLEDLYFNWAITAIRHEDTEKVDECLARMEEINPNGWRTLLTRADFEESRKEIWPAWEILREAFDVAFDAEEDFEACGYVAATLLHFAKRNDMQENVAEHIEQIFEDRLFSEDVLEALMALEDRHANAALSHQVVLQTPDTDGRVPVYVVYGVSAADPDRAGETALAFQARCQDGEWTVHSVQRISERDEGPVGVYWRSPELDRPPGPNPAARPEG